jgi:hypothetical protein
MTDLERLLAIEDIKRLKSKYFYYLDYKDWEGWRRDVFAPDMEFHVPEALEEPIRGVDVFIEWTAKSAGEQVSTHHGHMPDIEILTETTAKGIWAMEDILRLPKDKPSPMGYTYLHGFGHYHETYTKGASGWRIQTVRLTRLYVEMKHEL